MRYACAIPALVALVGFAGCQSDMAMHQIDRRGAYTESFEDIGGYTFESDTRRVDMNFTPPPLAHTRVVESDMVLVYLSVPIEAGRGMRFNDPSIGVSYSDVAMSLGGIFEPFPKEQRPWHTKNKRSYKDPTATLETPLTVEATGGTFSSARRVDPRYQEYAAVLREHLYGSKAPDTEVAKSAITPQMSAEDWNGD